MLERQVHEDAGIDTEGKSAEGKPISVVQIAVGDMCVIWPSKDSLDLMRVLKECSTKIGVLGLRDDISLAMVQAEVKLTDVRRILKQEKMVNPYMRNTPSLLDCYDSVARSEKYFYCKPHENMHWENVMAKRFDECEMRKWRMGPLASGRSADGVEIHYIDPYGVQSIVTNAPNGSSVWSTQVKGAIRTSESKYV